MELNYKSYGQGPAIVILHGLFGSLDNWVSHARRLSEDYSVYLFDARNHGRSPHYENFNYGIMAEDLREFLDQHGIYQTHLLGHSMGGKTVMNFANMYPERIDKLIVADMGIRQYPPHHNVILQALRSIEPTAFTSRNEVDEVLLSKGIEEQSVRQFLLKSLGRDIEKRLAWKFNFPIIDKHYDEVLKPVEMDFPFEGETLMIYGGNSHYVREEDKPSIKEQFPESTFIRLDDAGHWLHAEKPEEFLSEISEFLMK
jgi:pimeloyl-ACP methyl ester carboxylesterase